MKGKGFWVSILILLFLSGLYFYEVKKEKLIQKEKEGEKIVFKLADKPLDALELKNDNGSQIKIKKNGNWQIVSPVHTKVDSVELELYFSKVKKLKYVSLISKADSELSQFGLDNPTFSLSIESGNEKETLLIGSETPVGYQYYAMKAGEKEVFTLNDHDVKDLKKDLFAFRFKRLIEINPEEIEELIINTKGSEWSLKKKDGNWEGIQDIDPLKVDQLIGRLTWTQATGVMAEHKDSLEGFEFDNPKWKFTLKLKHKVVSVSFYKAEAAPEETLYATSDQTSHVFIMPRWLEGYLPKDPKDLMKL